MEPLSYDLAVWAGDRPVDAEAAGELVETLLDALEADEPVPPSPTIVAFMDDVLALWPDGDTGRDDFPWAVAPVMPESASGGTAYLNLTVHDRIDSMVADIARLAREHGLQAYDPQTGELVT